MRHDIRRGAVVEVNLDPTVGHETNKKRPCVVIQNDIGNANSPTTIVAIITGAEHVGRVRPFQVFVPKGEGGLSKDSVIKCDQVRTVDELRVGRTFGELMGPTMRRVDVALRVSLDL